MIEHKAKLFYYATRNFYRLQRQIAKAINERGGSSLPNKEEATATRKLVARIEREAERLKLSRVLDRLDKFNTDDELLHPLAGEVFTLQHLHFQLGELHEDIQRVLAENKFMMISASEATYYNNPVLFGSDVAERFPKANKEITEAGNCYATGNNTACVFHLMRAVELGARALVRQLKVSKNLPRPAELCDWGTIVRELEKATNNLPKRTSVKVSETSAFYSHAVAQFRNFKDAWRNQVSHTRTTYDEHQAMSVMSNTQQFMQHLAVRLKE